MTTPHSNVPSRRSSPYSMGGVTETEIDQSTRTPVLFFLGWALFWLLCSSVLGLATSLKLHWPQFLDGVSFLTYGRLQPVFINSFLYGWASCSVFAVGLWLMARLSQTCLRHGSLLLVAGTFWNLMVLIGLGGILLGETTSVQAMSLPAFTGPVLLLAYAMVACWAIFTYWSRQYRTNYTSQWYLLAAFFWFPWIYSVAQAMLVWVPVRGTVQSVINAWYAYNFFALWLAPLALAALYYFLPKILGRTIRYYYLAPIAFWGYAVLSPWAGVSVLSSGPVPAWVPTVGIVAKTLLIVPVAILSLNFFGTLNGLYRRARATTTLTFLLVAACAFVLFHLAQALVSFRGYQEVVQFTHVQTALWMIGKYAFFSMAVFGAVYFLLPRVLGYEWPRPTMAKTHFRLSLLGFLVLAVSLTVAGWIQGTQLNDPSISFIEVVRATTPWLIGASLGWILLLIGHIVFAWNVISLVRSRTLSEENRSVLLSNPPEMKVQTT